MRRRTHPRRWNFLVRGILRRAFRPARRRGTPVPEEEEEEEGGLEDGRGPRQRPQQAIPRKLHTDGTRSRPRGSRTASHFVEFTIMPRTGRIQGNYSRYFHSRAFLLAGLGSRRSPTSIILPSRGAVVRWRGVGGAHLGVSVACYPRGRCDGAPKQQAESKIREGAQRRRTGRGEWKGCESWEKIGDCNFSFSSYTALN